MNVLVFSAPEVTETSLNYTLSTLRSLLVPNYSVQTISQQSLASHPWTTTCALLVFPDGSSVSRSSAVPRIRAYLANGGALLGLATGARCSDVAVGNAEDLVLHFFDNITKSYIFPIFRPADKPSPRRVAVRVVGGRETRSVSGVFQNGQTQFIGVESDTSSLKVWAKYIDGEQEGEIAALCCRVGSGKAILWGPSLEYPITLDHGFPAHGVTLTGMSQEEINHAEEERLKVIQDTLQELGLEIPSQEVNIAALPTLPQFLTSHPSKPALVSHIMEALAAPSPAEQLSVFEDANDTFNFHTFAQGIRILNDTRSSSRPIPESTRHPKHIIICANGELPTHKQQTPLFDLALYYHILSTARVKEGLIETDDLWGMGDVVLYGETVTSTQTMLDKNPRFLSLLPTPLLSLASHQVAGRGRGSNVWLSPPGSLLFSLLLRLSLSSFPASKLVFVQYLFGLAVTEACREESILGIWGKHIRLKWPNDLYVTFGDGGAAPDDWRKRRKIGGILVTTSFSEGKIDLVIGCGLNLLNPPPIPSLSQLLPPGIPPPSMEHTAAVIMIKFEKMWGTFIAHGGSFDPFMGLYLERWLHSDQLVTLTTTVPSVMVRIMGITEDHGLLRTVPEKTGWSTGDGGFIDLQPDGNSFDLMSGMIKTKKSK